MTLDPTRFSYEMALWPCLATAEMHAFDSQLGQAFFKRKRNHFVLHKTLQVWLCKANLHFKSAATKALKPLSRSGC